MDPYRKLLVLGTNALLKHNEFSLDGGGADRLEERGYVICDLAGYVSAINWTNIGYEEIRVSVWWKYDHGSHPQAELHGNFRESFHTSSPLAKRSKYQNFVGVVASGWLERRDGRYLQGTGRHGISKRILGGARSANLLHSPYQCHSVTQPKASSTCRRHILGEAKRRASLAASIVYHHTSTLRTNLIWMSGVIELEGNSKGAFHPKLGEIQTDVKARRPCLDFPALAWFSSSIRIPRCLIEAGFQCRSQGDGTPVDIDPFSGVNRRLLSNGVALNRIALGFPLADSGIIPWREHHGYDTVEGRDLNESARSVGDDPELWYVSETPVDVMGATEVWVSHSKYQPKLERQHAYLNDVHRMVQMCRETEGVYIPPSWLTTEQAQALLQSLGAEVRALS